MHPEAKLDYAAAADYFTKSTGVTCTIRAVQEQIKKLKKISKDDVCVAITPAAHSKLTAS